MSQRERIEQLAKDDAALREELARCEREGVEWTDTLERLFVALYEDRQRLLVELESFRQHSVRMIPVVTMEQAGEILTAMKRQEEASSTEDEQAKS